MTNEEKINLIRQKCIDANPSILDLVFGCRGIDGIDGPVWIFNGINWQGEKESMFSVYEPEIILGRDIRLADVLVAIREFIPVKNTTDITYVTNSFNQVAHCWNFLKDRLEDQSGETIEFVYNLLANNK